MPSVIGRDRHVTGAGGLQFRPVLDLVGDVDELAGLLELRRVDQVHAHQVGHVARGDRLRELRHHFGVRDVGQVDLAVGILLVPHGDERVDHALVLPPLRSHICRSSAKAGDDTLAASARAVTTVTPRSVFEIPILNLPHIAGSGTRRFCRSRDVGWQSREPPEGLRIAVSEKLFRSH